MAKATQQTPRPRAESGVFRRFELERVLRSMTELELRELEKSGQLAELLHDVDAEPENPLEF